ncbi:malate synthase [Paramicrobacterium humi]|uniref:Malate synthase n=1 Tax=Paramicrobacterium humi TaxID=640635 RepID=A0A1H4TEL6_9MICO|nr:malate synthase A [Microbacterium humi]SEC54797.1 malate synthase [Microbacterium humi]
MSANSTRPGEHGLTAVGLDITRNERRDAPRGRLEVIGTIEHRFDQILSPEALEFVTELHDRFGVRRHELLRRDAEAAKAIDAGYNPRFLPETAQIREDPDWRVAGAAPGLEDRRVEITGPTDRKMTVNALNSGANVWLADHEDALSPTWSNVIGGQVNLYDAIRRDIDFVSDDGKEYRLGQTTPTIVFRPRGWHLCEKHMRYTNPAGLESAVSASLVDFGLYVFHNARELIARGSGPYFYLPKLESRFGARLWDEIFTFTEQALGLPHGTIRATVLIETITAAFEMDEILYELRDHCAGLNAGRWDYLFSIIKNFRDRGQNFVLPDRGQITMTVPFMRAYTELLVRTCHRRGAYAIGGMSAFIPNRRDPDVTQKALTQVADDKRREAHDGFDGTWVAHPDLIGTARAEFDAVLGGRENQLHRLREDVHVDASQLLDLRVPGGRITCAGIQQNVSVALRYIESWLRGAGAAAIDNLMEDAATAEISRSQLWQWVFQGAVTEDGMPIVRERVEWAIQKVCDGLARTTGDRLDDAAEILRTIVLRDEFPPFLTVPAYLDYLESPRQQAAAA